MENSTRLDSLRLLYDALPVNLDSYGPGLALLRSAALHAGEAEVSWLLEHGADGTVPNRMGDTPLHIAASCCNYKAVRALVRHYGPVILEARNRSGWTPLHNAAFRGDSLWLHHDQPEITHASGWGYKGGYMETIVMLICLGADPTARTADKQSWTPYELAKALGPEEHTGYLRVLDALGIEKPADANEELFWETCNGECYYRKRVLKPGRTWPFTIDDIRPGEVDEVTFLELEELFPHVEQFRDFRTRKNISAQQGGVQQGIFKMHHSIIVI